MKEPTLEAYLQEVRSLVIQEIREQLPPDGPWTGRLYERMLDYPLRAAKALRPSLCIATCRALGGALGSALPTAASLELFHNAFLVHDDVEDGSELRRGAPTLCREVGVPVAVNVGDGMLAMALRPLLRNARILGVQRGMKLMERVVEMAQRSAEGQALELEWIRTDTWNLTERDYLRMVYLILLHCLRHLPDSAWALRILSKAREEKSVEDILFLRKVINDSGSIAYARQVALQHAIRSRRLLQVGLQGTAPNVHRRFLEDLVDYVVGRDW